MTAWGSWFSIARLAFGWPSSSRQEVQREFDRLLRDERFNGGTDITRAMLDAADYIQRQGRRDARRAIVILTDDQTEFDRDDAAVGRALGRADAVMCALIAPDAMPRRQIAAADSGTVVGAAVAWRTLGGIIFGPRGGGHGYPGGDERAVRTRNRPERRRSRAIRAAIACRSTTPQR